MSQISPETTTLSYAAAIEAAIAVEMRDDPDVFTMGTMLAESLVSEFGSERVRVTPISEPSMTGIAVGAAGAGKRPVVNWKNVTFAMNSFDQVINQAAKIRYMFGGQRAFPIVFRAVCGGGQRLAAQHSQSPYSIYAHVPGLKVAVPSSPADAYGLMRAAIQDDNPVVFLEPARLAAVEGEVVADEVVPLGEAATLRAGDDLTVVSLGYMVGVCAEVIDELASDGVEAELIDLRTPSPLDLDAVLDSISRTGRLVVVDEAPQNCSVASEVVAGVASEGHGKLRAAPLRVCAKATPVPFSAPLEDSVLPGAEDVRAAIRAVLDAG